MKKGYKMTELGALPEEWEELIAQISHEKYLQIKTKGGIDECFTVN